MSTLTAQPARRKALPDAVIEMIYAGRDLANHLCFPTFGYTNCLCGTVTTNPTNPENHTETCPVARFYRSVEAVAAAEVQ